MTDLSNYQIPSVPTRQVDDDKTGLKNLAGWIARYKNLGVLYGDGFSPVVRTLFENGTFAQFEPSLTGYEAGQEGGDDEYERYEFSVCLQDFVSLNNEWASLHFIFGNNDSCQVIIENYHQDETGGFLRLLEKNLSFLGLNSLVEENSVFITWQDADSIILRHLNYINNNPEIPVAPI